MNEENYYEKILEHLNGSCPNYSSVLKSLYCNFNGKREAGDMNVLIPVHGRKNYLEPCVSYLRVAGDKAGLNLNIVVIENDSSPTMAEVSCKLKLGYIFIPFSTSYSEGMFAKSLCYNVGFLKTQRTKWNFLFGVDYLVEENFFEKVLYHLSLNPNWLQPYKGHTIHFLRSEETDTITRGIKIRLSDYKESSSPSLRVAGPTIVRDVDFIEVGGYDPEFFIGSMYADMLFWAKLELIHKETNEILHTNILDSASFANDPPIDIYHLHHPIDYNKNSEDMHKLLKMFFNSEYRRRHHIIGLKKLLFKQAMNIEG